MIYLLKNLHIYGTDINHKRDLLIKDGIICEQSAGVESAIVHDFDGCVVTAGWCDINAQFNDPGSEHKEDLISGMHCASFGGFTDVNLSPDLHPVTANKNSIAYLKSRSGNVDLHVTAALSVGMEGKLLTEMIDLHDAGARAFSEGDRSVWSAELLLKGLQYSSQVNAPIMQNAYTKELSTHTQMHEGMVSTALGMKGEPVLSEELMIQRDLKVLEYAGGKLHFTRVSSKEGVSLIKDAKRKGYQVTADVSLHHLIYTDEAVGEFDTVFKSNPPFRSEEDRKALIEGLIDDTIDAISSNHRPQDVESKLLEFDLADPGNISLQTFYPAYMSISEQLPFDVFIRKITSGPRKILGLKLPEIKVGAEAKLTVLDPNARWTLDDKSNKSKSINSPFWEQELVGMVKATVNGTHISIC